MTITGTINGVVGVNAEITEEVVGGQIIYMCWMEQCN